MANESLRSGYGGNLQQGHGAPEAETVAIDQEVLDDEYFKANFGITAEEAEIPVSYRDYDGTLGQMLTDPGCPVGADFKEAKQAGGREAVIERLAGYQSFYGDRFKLGEDGQLKAKDLPKSLDESKKKLT